MSILFHFISHLLFYTHKLFVHIFTLLCIFVFSVVVPFLATLIVDKRCFSAIAIAPNHPIEYQISYQTCVIFNHFILSGGSPTCAEHHTTERSISFVPPFVYSGECRDAVLTNYVPMIIISSASRAFLQPLLYLVLTNNHSDLSSNVCGIMGSLRSSILTNSSTRIQMTQIWSALLMLVTYGIMSPYATIAIAVNVIVQILFLRANIIRYFHLQVIAASKEGLDSKETSSVENNIDNVQNSQTKNFKCGSLFIDYCDKIMQWVRIFANSFSEQEENDDEEVDEDIKWALSLTMVLAKIRKESAKIREESNYDEQVNEHIPRPILFYIMEKQKQEKQEKQKQKKQKQEKQKQEKQKQDNKPNTGTTSELAYIGKLEEVCRDNQCVVAMMLWPGAAWSCLLFSLYVFDIAYDTNDLDLVAPLTLSIIPILLGLLVRMAFLTYTKKQEELRRERLYTKGTRNGDVELSDYSRCTENPMTSGR